MRTTTYQKWERKHVRRETFYTVPLPVAAWNAAVVRALNILKTYKCQDVIAIKQIKRLKQPWPPKGRKA